MSAGQDLNRRRRIHLYELMLLIAGLAVSLWLFSPTLRLAWGAPSNDNSFSSNHPFIGRWDAAVVTTLIVMLGGVSMVGVPLLLFRRWRQPRRPWAAGSHMWFSQGMASWLLWPPVIYRRIGGSEGLGQSVSGSCYYYGTPLMAVYVTAALWAGGSLRRSKRRRMALSWTERFGLLVGLLWACTGLYILAMFYREDFSR